VSDLVLLTGASGSLGRRLTPALRDAGWRVRALVHDRPAPGADEQVRGELADAREALQGVSGVIHAAALTHARRGSAYMRVNVDGTEALTREARDAGVGRFVHVSTHALSPRGGGYSRSKLIAEDVVRDSGVPFTIVRLPELYGAGSSEGLDRIVADARAGRRVALVGDGSQRIRPVHLDDAVQAVVAALRAPEALGHTYTLGGESMSVREFAQACGAEVRAVPVPVVVAAAFAARVLPLPLYPDQVARLRAARPPASPEAELHLGYRPRPVAEGLA
jgi:nucleoside-diphosphate-sugar epimerase